MMRITEHKTIASTLMAFAFASVVAAAQSPSFTTITGETGPGALYEIALPTGPWNGELVVFTHGIVPPSQPVALPGHPTFLRLRETLTSQGYALAYSSYSVTGYGGMKDGMQRTHQLRGTFASRVAQPARVYLVGDSMGGLISVMLVERFAGQYNGALSLCGIVGGGVETVTHLADARVLFDYFFPGVVPGTPFNAPPGVDFTPGGPTYTAVYNALIAGLADGRTLQFVKTAKLPAVGPLEVVKAGMSAVGMTVTQATNLLDVTNGHMYYDNSATEYSGSDNDEALNDPVTGVARYVAEPSAINYLEHYYRPSGDLRVPVLTLTTTRDPISPVFRHEEVFKEAVQNAGAANYLLQRRVDAFGHCGLPDFRFPDFEVVTDAFSTLVQWVSTGVKPQN